MWADVLRHGYVTLCYGQGDQIGWIFASWAIVYFGQNFLKIIDQPQI
jgi:hypothetical protein